MSVKRIDSVESKKQRQKYLQYLATIFNYSILYVDEYFLTIYGQTDP